MAVQLTFISVLFALEFLFKFQHRLVILILSTKRGCDRIIMTIVKRLVIDLFTDTAAILNSE